MENFPNMRENASEQNESGKGLEYQSFFNGSDLKDELGDDEFDEEAWLEDMWDAAPEEWEEHFLAEDSNGMSDSWWDS